jgi:hypothetical protein
MAVMMFVHLAAVVVVELVAVRMGVMFVRVLVLGGVSLFDAALVSMRMSVLVLVSMLMFMFMFMSVSMRLSGAVRMFVGVLVRMGM